MTPGQIKYTRKLLRQLDFSESDKTELVLQYTDNRTGSLTECNHKETLAIQAALKTALNIPTDTPADKMQRKIISMAHEMRWHLPDSCKIDMQQVNDWCINKTGFGKPLNQLNYSELPKAVTMMNGVYAAYLTAL